MPSATICGPVILVVIYRCKSFQGEMITTFSVTTAPTAAAAAVVISIITIDRLVGLVVKASASGTEHSGFEPLLCQDFFGVRSYQ